MKAKAKDISKLKNANISEFRLFDGIRLGANYVYVKWVEEEIIYKHRARAILSFSAFVISLWP